MLFPLGMTLSLAALGGPPEGERWVRVHLPTHESRQEAVSTGGFLEEGANGATSQSPTSRPSDGRSRHRVEDLPLRLPTMWRYPYQQRWSPPSAHWRTPIPGSHRSSNSVVLKKDARSGH